MKKTSFYLVALVLSAIIIECPALEDEHQKSIDGVAKLAPLVGKWHAVASFHDKDRIIENIGTYTIAYVLDHTYLQWEVELHNKDNPKRSQSWVIFTTFNPATNQYNQTYFYSNWAQRVTESGEYDDATKEYKTSALVPLEDGVRSECWNRHQPQGSRQNHLHPLQQVQQRECGAHECGYHADS